MATINKTIEFVDKVKINPYGDEEKYEGENIGVEVHSAGSRRGIAAKLGEALNNQRNTGSYNHRCQTNQYICHRAFFAGGFVGFEKWQKNRNEEQHDSDYSRSLDGISKE